MKILKFFLRFFLVLFILFFVAASIYVRIYGKSLVENALNAALKRNVVLGKASYQFPLGLSARNMSISRSLRGGEFLKVKRVVAHLSLEAVYQRKLAFDTVVFIEPSLTVEGKRTPDGISESQGSGSEGTESPVSTDLARKEEGQVTAKGEDQKAPVEVSVKRLFVKQGRVKYKEGLTEKGFSFNLEDVQLKAEKIVFPVKEGRSSFKMSARLVKEGNPLSGSSVQAFGWVDVVRRDMEARVEVIEANGTVGLTAEAASKNNEMEVTGKITMQNLLQGVAPKPFSGTSSVNDLVLNALSSVGIEIGAKFAFQTKMDDFRVGKVLFSGNVATK